MMDANYKISVVEDDATTRLLFKSILSKCYSVEVFETGEDCIEHAAHVCPDLFMLDVGLTGINGYEVCRALKSNPATASVPAIFVSGHDNLDDVLNGYDAGGEDYILKPFEAFDLINKIENVRRIERERQALLEQARASEELVSLLLGNNDENTILIKFLRSLNECDDFKSVADALLSAVDALHLEGAVQIRLQNREHTYSKTGENWPMEVSVINHVRTLDRIFQFKQRAAYNFECITLLITNMPIDNAEQCGRLRDSLAIMAESANARLLAQQSVSEKNTMQGHIQVLLNTLSQTVQRYGKRYDQARYEGAECTQVFLDELLRSFAHLGMSDQQEAPLLAMARSQCNHLIDLYDIAGDTQATLTQLSRELEDILSATPPDQR